MRNVIDEYLTRLERDMNRDIDKAIRGLRRWLMDALETPSSPPPTPLNNVYEEPSGVGKRDVIVLWDDEVWERGEGSWLGPDDREETWVDLCHLANKAGVELVVYDERA